MYLFLTKPYVLWVLTEEHWLAMVILEVLFITEPKITGMKLEDI